MPPGTHTQSWDWGRPGRPAGPRGTPAAVARKPRGQARGPGLSPALAALSAPPARGAALPGAAGRFQFRLRDPGCTLRPEGQPEEGRRGHRPGRTCRPAAPRPRGSGCSSPTRALAHRRRSIPLCRSSPPLNKGSPPPHYPLERWALQEGSIWQGPWVRDTRTNKVVSSQSETHTQTLARTRRLQTHSPRYPLFQSPQPHGPCCGHSSPVRVERGQRRTAARPGEAWPSHAAREVPSFPSLLPGVPSKPAA